MHVCRGVRDRLEGVEEKQGRAGGKCCQTSSDCSRELAKAGGSDSGMVGDEMVCTGHAGEHLM